MKLFICVVMKSDSNRVKFLITFVTNNVQIDVKTSFNHKNKTIFSLSSPIIIITIDCKLYIDKLQFVIWTTNRMKNLLPFKVGQKDWEHEFNSVYK